jgi:hypothetical protein
MVNGTNTLDAALLRRLAAHEGGSIPLGYMTTPELGAAERLAIAGLVARERPHGLSGLVYFAITTEGRMRLQLPVLRLTR